MRLNVSCLHFFGRFGWHWKWLVRDIWDIERSFPYHRVYKALYAHRAQEVQGAQATGCTGYKYRMSALIVSLHLQNIHFLGQQSWSFASHLYGTVGNFELLWLNRCAFLSGVLCVGIAIKGSLMKHLCEYIIYHRSETKQSMTQNCAMFKSLILRWEKPNNGYCRVVYRFTRCWKRDQINCWIVEIARMHNHDSHFIGFRRFIAPWMWLKRPFSGIILYVELTPSNRCYLFILCWLFLSAGSSFSLSQIIDWNLENEAIITHLGKEFSVNRKQWHWYYVASFAFQEWKKQV